MNGKKWIKIWGTTFITLSLFLGGFNYLVDPYTIFYTNNLQKYLHNKYRITNSIVLKTQQFDTLIIGTSRTQGALDTHNNNLQGNTYNVSMSGSNVYEIEKVFDFIIKNQNHLDTIIYGVDFLTFSDKRYPGEQFKESLFNQENNIYNVLFINLFSISTTKESLKTIIYNLMGKESNYIHGYIKNKQPSCKQLQKSFKKILTNNFLISPETYGCYYNSNERLELFNNILKLVYKKNIKLKLFIPPLQYRQYIALYHLGLLDIYLEWIKDIANKVDKINKIHKSNLIELYDFSGINYITTEEIPKNENEKMQYYLESSHYTSTAGDVILDRLYGKNDFGIKLNDIDIDTYISNKKKNMMNFFNYKSDTVSEIKDLFIQTIPQRKEKCSKYKNVFTKME